MFLVKVECKNVTVEKIAEHLAVTVELGFKVWLYDKKVYATFKIGSLVALKKLIKNLRKNGLKFKLFRIQEV